MMTKVVCAKVMRSESPERSRWRLTVTALCPECGSECSTEEHAEAGLRIKCTSCAYVVEQQGLGKRDAFKAALAFAYTDFDDNPKFE